MNTAQEQFVDRVFQEFATSPPVSLVNTLRCFLENPRYSSQPIIHDFANHVHLFGNLVLTQNRNQQIVPWAAHVTHWALKQPARTLACANLVDLLRNLPPIIDCYMSYEPIASPFSNWAHTLTTIDMGHEVHALSKVEAGLHFKPKSATQKKLRYFGVQSLAKTMEDLAPLLWRVLDTLLSADPTLAKLREQRAKKRRNKKAGANKVADPSDHDEEEEVDEDGYESDFWRELGLEEELQESRGQSAPDNTDLGHLSVQSHQKQITTICKVSVLSILAKSSNQRCNALASGIGIFLHACHAPERVVQMLSSQGLCLSPTAINTAIDALAAESSLKRWALGATLLVSYAFDNFDVFFTSDQPTVENAGGRTLSHLTSGTMIPLLHGVVAEDLQCSDTMWQLSAHNPSNARTSEFLQRSVADLHSLHPEPETPVTDNSLYTPVQLSRQQRFQRFVFLRDLIEEGPAGFRVFADQLKLESIRPEDIDLIPLGKTEQTPAQAMAIDESTPQGCGDAIEQILLGAGVGDPNEKDEDGNPRFKVQTDISNSVIIVHCDLASVAHLQSFMDSRALEETPWRQYQFVVIVPGIFHTLMACADSLWRTYIQPNSSRTNSCSTFKHAGVLFSNKKLGEIATGPTFRQTHNIVLHDGVCRRLAAWRSAIAQETNGQVTSLEMWAAQEPGVEWETLVRMAGQLVLSQVPEGPLERKQDTEKQDASYENNQLQSRDYLLYEETYYAMNHGDIGRLETCLVRWIYVWRATGKHPYANQITRFLLELHFLWPEKLKQAIRLNWLVNPRGKRDTHRGVDWLVERNNLYTKIIHGGEYSNRTLRYMLKESVLIDVYRWTQVNVEDNFCIPNRTINHAPPKMGTTYDAVQHLIAQNDETVYTPGRKVLYMIQDTLKDGMELAQRSDVLAHRRVVGGESAGTEAAEDDDSEIDSGAYTAELTGDDLLV